ncbi:kinase-like domain-containing protein [Jimgerdemannia flammicorona]|uniref:non-specific serine/threonine protein kinase n=1 Tax=Jimgerdemannia flammicorona TaxID=994334 RepID=A0A433QM15_9FUNG|nr:kinase-like domain-containing protein [Jimgerdemannia flammicorona]
MIVMELADGDLNDLIRKGNSSASSISSFYLHDNNIAHRDLKLNNILYKRDGDTIHIWLCDLAFARKLGPVVNCSSDIGTTNYISLELLNDSECYNPFAADIWALSITLFKFLTTKHPWKKAHVEDECYSHYLELRESLFDSTNPSCKYLCPAVKDLLLAGLDPDPLRRPDIHSFSNDFQKLRVLWSEDGAEDGASPQDGEAIKKQVNSLLLEGWTPSSHTVNLRKRPSGCAFIDRVAEGKEDENADGGALENTNLVVLNNCENRIESQLIIPLDSKRRIGDICACCDVASLKGLTFPFEGQWKDKWVCEDCLREQLINIADATKANANGLDEYRLPSLLVNEANGSVPTFLIGGTFIPADFKTRIEKISVRQIALKDQLCNRKWKNGKLDQLKVVGRDHLKPGFLTFTSTENGITVRTRIENPDDAFYIQVCVFTSYVQSRFFPKTPNKRDPFPSGCRGDMKFKASSPTLEIVGDF